MAWCCMQSKYRKMKLGWDGQHLVKFTFRQFSACVRDKRANHTTYLPMNVRSANKGNIPIIDITGMSMYRLQEMWMAWCYFYRIYGSESK